MQSIRLLGILCLSQALILSFIAKDLHHLVIGTPLFWLFWVEIWRHNADLGWKLAFGIAPFFLGNIQVLIDSPSVISAVQTPSFSEESQEHLVDILRQNEVQKLVTMDYEIYGVLEALTPDINILHGWGAISHERRKALPELLKQANGGHLLVLKASSGMIYNLQPTAHQLKIEAKKLGLKIELEKGCSENIWLYSVFKK